MKYVLTLVITLFFGTSFLKGQTPFVQFEGKKFDILDTSYHFSEAIQVIFYENNGPEFWKLRNEISGLDFDHCNHSFMFFLYVDTAGQLNKIQLVEGSTQPPIDSIVNAKVSSVEHVVPVNYNGATRSSLIVLRFRYFAKADESRLSQNYTADKCKYLYKKVTIMRTNIIGGSNTSNECENDLYFYNEGIKYYNSVKYSKAIYNFSQALEVNPADIEAKYYLGLSYQKDDNLKKACKCFSEGVQKGHEESIKAFNKYCSDTPEN